MPDVQGDYNDNGIVDAADYVVWRNSLGQSVTLPNDATPGTVMQEDYDVWRRNFGGGAIGSATAVPEPAMIVLCMLGVVGFSLMSDIDRKRGAVE
jgi:hypothetical protein